MTQQEAQMNEMRIALVTQAHELISTLEQLACTHHDPDARRSAEGCIRFARHVIEPFNYNGQLRTPPVNRELTADSVSLLNLLADIRKACGDEAGRLMQDELVEHIRAGFARLSQQEAGQAFWVSKQAMKWLANGCGSVGNATLYAGIRSIYTKDRDKWVMARIAAPTGENPL